MSVALFASDQHTEWSLCAMLRIKLFVDEKRLCGMDSHCQVGGRRSAAVTCHKSREATGATETTATMQLW